MPSLLNIFLQTLKEVLLFAFREPDSIIKVLPTVSRGYKTRFAPYVTAFAMLYFFQKEIFLSERTVCFKKSYIPSVMALYAKTPVSAIDIPL